MLHRCARCWCARPGPAGRTVEVDETYIGGEEPGLRGGRAPGKKVLTGISVEVTEPKGIGRCRWRRSLTGPPPRCTPSSPVTSSRATVITDAWLGYRGLASLSYAHQRRSQLAARARGDDPGELLPAVHRVASLAKRGCWAPTRARSMRRTCPDTSTSSRSASTAAARPAAAWCSTACSARRRPRPGPLPRPDCQPAARVGAALAATHPRSPAQSERRARISRGCQPSSSYGCPTPLKDTPVLRYSWRSPEGTRDFHP